MKSPDPIVEIIEYTDVYPSGKLKIKGILHDNIKEGEWIEYFENGKIQRIVNYHKGKKNGKCFVFKEDGNIDFCMNYKNGSLIFSPKIKKLLHLRGGNNF